MKTAILIIACLLLKNGVGMAEDAQVQAKDTYITAEEMSPCLWKKYFPSLKRKLFFNGTPYYMNYEEYSQHLLADLCPDTKLFIE